MKQIAFALVLAMLPAATAVRAPAQSRNIVQTAVATGQFKTLVKALRAAGLVNALEGSGPFTVFAPTDAAFSKLPPGTLASLLKPENKARLREILTYHVVQGDVTSAQVIHLSSAQTLDGKEVQIRVEDGAVRVNDALVVKADIRASNGVIHAIDAVLLPGAAN